jgi:NadR type nicotinamide-nucleotide adenylyltransferase
MKKIAITGPESTGKSTLARELARIFQTTWVPEYAREYLLDLGRPYEEGDILEIARGQLKTEEKLMNEASRLLFCDTDFLVTRIWSVVKYGRSDPWIDKKVVEHRYDLYLLCNIDLPWEFDPLREHPDKRLMLFDLYHRELINRGFPFAIVSGEGAARTAMAVDLVKFHLL